MTIMQRINWLVLATALGLIGCTPKINSSPRVIPAQFRLTTNPVPAQRQATADPAPGQRRPSAGTASPATQPKSATTATAPATAGAPDFATARLNSPPSPTTMPALPAFPGAQGYGAASVGGRGGRVVHVTTLKNTGPGSLSEALTGNGPRIVVFDVSGVIKGEVTLRCSNVTIAGQTAPGAGITIEGRLLNVWQNPGDPAYPKWPALHDVIIRHIRVRPPAPVGSGGDCMQLTDIDRLIIDHCSLSWGSDENLDLCSTRTSTVQWTTIEESDGRRSKNDPESFSHNFGMITGYYSRDISIHHNLFAHQSIRAPLCGTELMDHRNNVVYNIRDGVVWHPVRMNRRRVGEKFQANVIGNYFKEGPDFHRDPTGKAYANPIIQNSRADIYTAGASNYFDWVGGYVLTKKPGVFEVIPTRTEPYPAVPVDTQTATEAYELVLGGAGAFPRDAVTQRTVNEVHAGTGAWGRHDPAGGLMEGLSAGRAPQDSDNDGIPDAWELAHKLNPRDPSDGRKIVPAGASPKDRHKGYTYIEYYLNDLSDTLIARASTRPVATAPTTQTTRP